MINYSCPTCATVLESLDQDAGDKVSCPKCGQHLRVPSPNRTVLGRPVGPTESVPEATPAPPSVRRRSSRRDDDYDDDYDDRRRRRSRRRREECPYCGSTRRPFVRNQISTAGWILFAVMLVVFFPLFFIGLLMTENVYFCDDCGARLP